MGWKWGNQMMPRKFRSHFTHICCSKRPSCDLTRRPGVAHCIVGLRQTSQRMSLRSVWFPFRERLIWFVTSSCFGRHPHLKSWTTVAHKNCLQSIRFLLRFSSCFVSNLITLTTKPKQKILLPAPIVVSLIRFGTWVAQTYGGKKKTISETCKILFFSQGRHTFQDGCVVFPALWQAH